MKPFIHHTEFGSITIENNKFDHDVFIQLDGSIHKRKKKLSKTVFGTSHVISLDEAKYIFEKKAQLLIIGTGQYDQVRLSEEAAEYFNRKKCRVYCKATPKAIELWNKSDVKRTIALFHITC
jgi:hypothetical protein